MIDPSRDRLIIGPPGPLTAWVFSVVRALAPRTLPKPLSIVAVERLATVDAPPPDGPGRLLLCNFPSDEVVAAINATDLRTLVVEEPGAAVALHLVQTTNRTPIEAVRACSAAYIANLALRRSRHLAVFNGEDRSPVLDILKGLCRYLALEVAEPELAKYADKIAPGPNPDHPLAAAVQRSIRASGTVVSQADAETTARFSAVVLTPMIEQLRVPTVPAIEWPRNAFYDVVRPKEPLPDVIDLTGPARMLVHGPYFHLAPGRYIIELVMAFAEVAKDATFLVDVHAGAERLKRVRVHPSKSGGYTARFEFDHKTGIPEVQVQIVAERGAIAGRFALVRCLLTPILA